ncbi:11716_t:CDS:2 [Scutellospora calospora]|uniref:11716_t:CDS:1 n=1 Tax=Scutellospora calospora TaxID=85575 RepID=A0ACA9MEA0_9GLOM|nr:11716_t:CDS:2 [Scutellospora calospora]
MLVLFETAAGYALFQVLNEGKLETPEELWKAFETPQEASNTIKLKAFKKFENMASAVSSISDVSEGKLSDDLNNFLKETIGETSIRKEKLIVADPKLGSTINKKLGIQVQSEKIVIDLFRGIRQHIDSLITGMDPDDISSMALGLSHSLSRHKLKFSPDKVDTMIIQAIGLLDDLDKELNTYAMRVKEWYGWHFPEMSKIVVDNLAYAKVVKAMGFRVNAQECDLSDILPEELENEVKEAAEISMGTEISEEDINNIVMGCDQVISLTAYRTELYEYLKNRMLAIAPNLTTIVGELVGARLISHAGSLLNLAKHPSSTIQILGAEKALFRALKTKNATPKYGLIYHASLVGQASPKNKGKIARIVASKSSLATRFDAIADEKDLMAEMGQNCRKMIETRLRILEKGGTIITTDKRKKQPKFELISYPVEAGPSGTKAEESEESDDKMDTDSDDSESESLSKSEGKKPVKMQIEPIASDKKKEKKRKKPEKHVSDDEDLSKKMTASIIEESTREIATTEEPVFDKKKEKKKKAPKVEEQAEKLDIPEESKLL